VEAGSLEVRSKEFRLGHKVVFISPHLEKPGKFHDQAYRFMKLAAENLDLDLATLNTSATRDLRGTVQDLLAGRERPGGVVLVNSQNLAAPLFSILEDAGVHSVVAYEGFYETDRPTVGVPGSPYRFWRGEIMPDDVEVGRVLARTLIDRAVSEARRDETSKIRILTLSGPFTQAATNRLTGFREVVQKSAENVVYDLHMADWSAAKGYEITADYLKQTQPQAIWAANDSIARGAAKACDEAGLRPGADVLIGGVDWVGGSLEQVAAGRMTTSVGGHILDGVWALIMIRDALNGHPPPRQRALTSSMVAVTSDNARHFLRVVDEDFLRSVDFDSLFSSADGSYEFSLQRLLD
jgi:ABC-type sugar transport system substrate-binding protein